MRLWCISDVELASACILTGMSHSKHTALVLVRVDLTVDGIAWTASTISVRAAALSYETRYYTVECKSVIEPGVR
ncbi:hypothetical protein D3C72_1531220 [compost metagenome]